MGNDEINGGKGNDDVNGGAGDDHIAGGTGKDTIIGGAGRDVMTGGAGDDIFRFLPGVQTPPGAGKADIITDFQQIAGPEGDKLQLPTGSTVIWNEVVHMNGVPLGWYLEYLGGGNSGFILLTGLSTAPDYEFV